MKPEVLRERIKGVVNIMPTPFTADGTVNVEGLKQNAEFLVNAFQNRKASIVTCGSTSEFYAMNDEENKVVARTVVDAVKGRVPVIVGTARAGTEPTIEMSRYAESIGADGIMVVSPYYHMPSREGIVKHFTRVAESVGIGMMIYNNPTTSKMWMDVELMKRLSGVPNIIASKENTIDMGQFYGMLQSVSPDDMTVMTGLNEIYYSFLWQHGCSGFISSTVSNFAPELPLELYEASERRDMDTVNERVRAIAPFFDYMMDVSRRHGPIPTVMGPVVTPIEHPVYISIVKEAMDLVGLAGGEPRGPMEPITATERDELANVLRKMGVLK